MHKKIEFFEEINVKDQVNWFHKHSYKTRLAKLWILLFQMELFEILGQRRCVETTAD